MKKNEKLFDSIGDIDSRFVYEASPKRIKDERRAFSRVKVIALAASLALIVGTLAFLFVPLSNDKVSPHRKSEYFNVIASLDGLYSQSRRNYKNMFDKFFNSFGVSKEDESSNTNNGDINFGADNAPKDDAIGEYVETTDNQVEGVIEADIFKRTDKYIYYLFENTLYVYSIAAEESELIWSIDLDMPENMRYRYGDAEMYLSLDGGTVTIISPYINKDSQNEIALLTVALGDGKPQQTETVRVRGSYVSSRFVDGEIILISSFRPSGVDYGDPETFVPSFNCGDGYECIDPSDIVLPSKVATDRYTVITTYEQSDSTLISSMALLSYSDNVYATEDAIYVTMTYTQYADKENIWQRKVMTDITRVVYSDGVLTQGLTYTVDGSVLNQYSLDERDGVIRVVTTIDEWNMRINSSSDDESVSSVNNGTTASLFCIDIESGEIIGKVEKFAPLGEEVTSVRFDGDSLYVCTAVVVKFTDPVFFFDLSDMTNITYTDTGYIDGFSSSLINMGDGLLLGIGSEDFWHDKVETYAEADGEVISLDKYIVYGDVATEYKAYYVNREEGLFGFGAVINNRSSQGYYDRIVYILLRVEDGQLSEVFSEELNSDVNLMRGTLIDGYFYMLGSGEFKVLSLTEV